MNSKKGLTLQVLLSCMNQSADSIAKRTNLKDSYVIVNQSDYEFVTNTNDITVINSKERGLSKSRNMAIRNSKADICLICDDDEILDDDYSDIIVSAFKDNPHADIIAFKILNTGKSYPATPKRINYIRALQLASWQLTFRRKSIVDNNIWFDETLGSGVSKAGGEENKFLYDCLKKGLKIIYLPLSIGKMIDGESQWFHGYTEEYFFDRGVMTRRLMGPFFATLYALYYLIRKYHLYNKDISISLSMQKIFQGIFNKHNNKI